MAALWVTKLGAKVRIVDKTDAPGTTSRALAVQARTLELYRQLDLADAVVKRAHKVPAINFGARGRREVRIPFEEVGAGWTRYPYLKICPQDEHERLLVARLEEDGVSVERRTELVECAGKGDRVVARLRLAERCEETCEAAFIVGCDGAHSVVRDTVHARFPGGTSQRIFYVPDVEASGQTIDGELHIDLDDSDFLAVLGNEHRHRRRHQPRVETESGA